IFRISTASSSSSACGHQNRWHALLPRLLRRTQSQSQSGERIFTNSSSERTCRNSSWVAVFISREGQLNDHVRRGLLSGAEVVCLPLPHGGCVWLGAEV